MIFLATKGKKMEKEKIGETVGFTSTNGIVYDKKETFCGLLPFMNFSVSIRELHKSGRYEREFVLG